MLFMVMESIIVNNPASGSGRNPRLGCIVQVQERGVPAFMAGTAPTGGQ